VPRPDSARVLESNMAALAHRNPALASAIRSSTADPSLTFVSARDGTIVPSVQTPHGSAPLHSLYDPAGEARKIAAGLHGAGCIVILGMGAGFAVAASLEDVGVSSVLVIEKDVSILRALLERLPLDGLLQDPRVFVSVGLEGVRPALLSAWQPALMGGMVTAPLRPWCEKESVFFAAATAELRTVINEIRADYSVQAHFGKRWFSNMLLNMEPASSSSVVPPAVTRVSVVAAGPSLERQLGMLSATGDTDFLLASDASLPALRRAGIQPHGVLSIDCQSFGYHHFLQGISPHSILFLDLASPHFLARSSAPLIFAAGGHPFAAYLDARWKRFPRMDTSGGNVTHAAVSLAHCLGARAITVFGADFSYPEGKPYSRGTYLYDFFESSQTRVAPSESKFFSFIYRTPDTRKEHTGGGFRYTTDVMLGYRYHLLRLMGDIPAEVTSVPGAGLALDQAVRRIAPRSSICGEDGWRSSRPSCSWRRFLAGYAGDLAALPALTHPAGSSFRTLRGSEQELWGTLLPVAARVILDSPETAPGAAAMDGARQWVLSRVARVIDGSRSFQE
jgi:hypothetical protein